MKNPAIINKSAATFRLKEHVNHDVEEKLRENRQSAFLSYAGTPKQEPSTQVTVFNKKGTLPEMTKIRLDIFQSLLSLCVLFRQKSGKSFKGEQIHLRRLIKPLSLPISNTEPMPRPKIATKTDQTSLIRDVSAWAFRQTICFQLSFARYWIFRYEH